MSAAAVVAGAAGACAVGAAWEGLAALEQARAVQAVVSFVARLRATGAQGRPSSAPERRRLVLVGAATLLAGGWLVGGPLAAAACAAAGPWTARQLLATRRRRWRRALSAGAPAVARALADALAGGHSVHGAIELAARSGGLGVAAGAELGRCAAALALGEPTEAALERLARRADHPAYDTVVAAILLQRDAGGDLATLLRDLAATLEEAAGAEADARAATAQARFTGWLVAALPPGAAAITALLDPAVLSDLASSAPAASLLAAAAACELLALVALRRLARVGEE